MGQYPLLRRFQGSLMGTVLGECLAQVEHPMSQMMGPMMCDRPFHGSFRYGELLWCSGQSLLGEWGSQKTDDRTRWETTLQTVNWGDWIETTIVLIPQMLLGHEHPSALERVFRTWGQRWGIPAIVHPGVWLVAGVLSLGLRNQWRSPSIVHPLREWLNAAGEDEAERGRRESGSVWQGHLHRLQEWLDQSQSLLSVQQMLRSERLDPATQQGLLVLYCFLSLPDDFAGVLGRGLAVIPQGRSAGALAGALAGAYNTPLGMPGAWRRSLAGLELPWNGAGCDRLAEALLLAWAGVDQAVGGQANLPLVTAPRPLNLQRIRR